MNTVTEFFGSMVFNDAVMQSRLPGTTYQQLQATIQNGSRLDSNVANIVANAMKDWAIEKGATHFTHWFQPMNGVTAEKHDSFISPVGGGKVIMEFSGTELVRGESDASSFPSGGLRATFEARGYTAWDPTSYAFIKDGVLCIPTAFCSYGGEALDTKTPLLRSMEAINRQALRVLKLFGHDRVKTVKTTVGAEQEYFLVDEEMFLKRKDLIFTGRTLFGAMPPKGQEMEDHYFGVIKPKVAAFMKELDEELWKLGILAKTEHNEAAPAQHELAPIFTTTNIAVDHNQVTMELMQRIARRHGLVCLLHEKPFAGVNGSGKHNNWSISTDTGINLLEPGDTPYENAQFLLFLCAVIRAVDDYQDLLRISVSSAGNDHRLGADEAPPAIISMFLGDELEAILNAIDADEAYVGRERSLLKVGVDTIPRFAKDNTDRNRTSPLAFTGNKFEFRMPGSSVSVARCNIVLNTAVAESLRVYANELDGAADFSSALHDLIRREVHQHKRIIFNGNGYEESWVKEAEQRGLMFMPSCPDCLPMYIAEKNVDLYARHRVLRRSELLARQETAYEEYSKLINIEARTMLDMASKDYLPAVSRFIGDLSAAANARRSFLPDSDCSYETAVVSRLSALCAEAHRALCTLDHCVKEARSIADARKRAEYVRDQILPAMAALRSAVDSMEPLTASDYWPCPSYDQLLFGVR